MNATMKSYLESEIGTLKARGVYRLPRVLQTAAGPRVRMDGRDIIQLSSNNYLGLTTHPRLVAAARRARWSSSRATRPTSASFPRSCRKGT